MILGKLVNLWQHWASAILGILPNWLVAPGIAFHRPLVVEIKNLNHFFEKPLKVIEAEIDRPVSKLQGRLIDVSLDHHILLERQVKLPKMTKKHFAKAMEVSLQKASPIPVDKLTWRHGVQTVADGSIITTQYIIKNDKLVLLDHTMATLGLNLRKVTLNAANSAFLDRSIKYDRPKRAWLLINLILVLAFCGWVVFLKASELRALQYANADLGVQITELQNLAVNQSKRVSLQINAAELAEKTSAELKVGQSRTATLENLSAFLSDEVWITELLIKGASVSLNGFTTLDVATLVSNLKNENWVTDAHLKSAISGASNSKSKRFQIQLDLNIRNVTEHKE